MSSLSLDQAALEVIQCYSRVCATARLVHLGNRGGFSGARIWRVETSSDVYCLRAWPPGEPSPERLKSIHELMLIGQRAGLEFLPRLLLPNSRSDVGGVAIEHAGRLWELTTWLPGCADYHDRPNLARLEAVCTALALLHNTWAAAFSTVGPCSGVRRRIDRAQEWITLLRTGWQPQFEESDLDPVRPWAERAWKVLRQRVDGVILKLAPWVDRPFPLQPCLCDIWHDHVLFEGDKLTGIVDFGSVKVDHVTVDMARLLGSLAGDDAGQRAAGLRAYTRLRSLSNDEESLVVILDETGTLLGAANWLTWLYREGKKFEDRCAIARRLGELVKRLDPS